MVQIIGSQIKSYRIQIEKSTDITTQAERPTFNRATTTCRLEVHAISQTTELNNHLVREDSTHALSNPILFEGEAVTCRRPGAWGQQVGISMARRVFGSDATAKPTSI